MQAFILFLIAFYLAQNGYYGMGLLALVAMLACMPSLRIFLVFLGLGRLVSWMFRR